MSGTYTQTPNLGLFKPTPNSDTGAWGYHLNANADTLDNLLASTGPTAQFLPLAGGEMTGGLLTTATGATTARSSQDRAAAAMDPRDFGVQFNGTDETALFQTYLNYCRDNAVNWYLPHDLVADGITFYTSGRAADGARILATNNGQNAQVVAIAPAAADIINVPSTEFSGWGSLFRGSAQISGLSGRRGQYIMIVQNDLMIGRYGSAAPINQQAGFVVWSDTGDIYPAFPDNFTWPGTSTVVTAQITRHQIVIDNLVVELSDPPGGNTGGERNRVVQITRSNVTLRGCQVRSDSATVGIQQGFVVSNASSVQFDRCVVDNIRGSGTTNYGYSQGVSVDITYTDCQARKTRRGIDGTYVNMVRVRGGLIDGGIGAHWGHDIVMEGVTMAVDYTGGSETPLLFAGGNIRAHHCDITVTGGAQAIMTNRSDIFELYGAFELTNCNIFIDNRNNAIQSSGAISLMSLAAQGNPALTYDTLRPVTMPSLVNLSGNRVLFLGPSAVGLNLLYLLNNYTAMPQTITVDGTVIIENNQFELENGLTDGSGNPRLVMTAVRPSMQIGNGYRYRIKGLPTFYLWGYAASSVVNNASRHAFHLSEVTGPVLMNPTAGLFSRMAMINCIGGLTVGVANPGTGYAPVGDEIVYSRDEATLNHTFYRLGTGTITQQPALLVNNTVGGPAYLQLSAVASQPRYLRWNTAGGVRWQLSTQNTETGSGNAGCDLVLTRFDDTNNSLGSVLTLNRSTGSLVFNGPMGFFGGAASGKPTVGGACAGNTAIKNLLTALAGYGLITDTTSA